jgi:phosphoglycerate dehydrogenase-like enzyme
MAHEKILYLGPPDTREMVANALVGYETLFATTDDEVDAFLPQCVGVLDAYMKVTFRAERINMACNLRAVVTATTGSTHIDGDSLSARGIPLLTLRGQSEFLRNITPAAELSWMLLMMCARRIRSALDDVSDGIWDRNRHPGLMLNGRTLGIIGCGRIGGWMARYAAAFGMECYGFDPHIASLPEHVKKASLESILEKSDFVSLHVNFDESLRKMIGRNEFMKMKRGTIFINTSRGELTDEGALADALISGHLGGAGLDVLADEPEVSKSRLLSLVATHPNLVITPHIGGYSPDALGRVLQFSCDRLLRSLKGDPV